MPRSKKFSELPVLEEALGTDGLFLFREIDGKLKARAGTVQSVVDLVGELGGGIPVAEKGAAGGVATLDGGGKLPGSQLPAISTSVVSEGSNLYFTGARAIAAVLTGFSAASGTVSSSDSVLQALQKVVGNQALKVNSSEKGEANGVATLGADGKVPNAQLPALAITDTFVVNSEEAMLDLSDAEVGDVVVRTDLSKSFILAGEPSSELENWQELLTPPGGVTSVNGQTGAVTIAAFTGDSGSGGVAGLVPAPGAGDATKFLRGDGGWAAISAIGGSTGATDKALLRASGTGGSTLQNSVVTLDGLTMEFGHVANTPAIIQRAAGHDIFIKTLGTNGIGLFTNNSQRLYVTYDGQVVITDTVSTYPLEVQGIRKGQARVRLFDGTRGRFSWLGDHIFGFHTTDTSASSWLGVMRDLGFIDPASRAYFGQKTMFNAVAGSASFSNKLSGSTNIWTPAHQVVVSGDLSGASYAQFINQTTDNGAGDGLLVGINADEEAVINNQENTALKVCTNNALRGTILAAGGWVLGSGALAIDATNGFTYLPSCPGTPTGVPSAITGMVPIVVDSSGEKLWAYVGGAWKSVTFT